MKSAERILDLLRQAGLQSSIDSAIEFWGKEGAVESFAARAEALGQAYSAYARYFPEERRSSIPRLDELAIDETLQRNPKKMVAFLQALEVTSSPDLLVMVWRIIHGDAIKRIDMHYAEKGLFELKVTLEDTATGEESCYVSQDIDDAVLLRHIGVMKIDELPVFEGFFAI